MCDPTSDPLETVSYLLACHKIKEAVDVLCEACLFKEALVFAKANLPVTDSIISEIIKRWAVYCERVGSFEVAALWSVHKFLLSQLYYLFLGMIYHI